MIVKSSVQVRSQLSVIQNIEEAFKFLHQSIITEIKNSVSKDWTVIETIVKHNIKTFECWYKQK